MLMKIYYTLKHLKKKSLPTKCQFHFGKFNWRMFVSCAKLWFVLEKYLSKGVHTVPSKQSRTNRQTFLFKYSCQLMEYQCSYFSGLDREYGCTDRGGSACGHRSTEERQSVLLLTVIVTIFLTVLYWCVRFIRQVTITLEGRNLSIKLVVSVYTWIVLLSLWWIQLFSFFRQVNIVCDSDTQERA